MSEMVERVARALCRERSMPACSCKRDAGECKAPTYVLDECGRLRQARAAIAAIREPTEAMIRSGFSRSEDMHDQAAVFRAMIDEAMK